MLRVTVSVGPDTIGGFKWTVRVGDGPIPTGCVGSESLHETPVAALRAAADWLEREAQTPNSSSHITLG